MRLRLGSSLRNGASYYWDVAFKHSEAGQALIKGKSFHVVKASEKAEFRESGGNAQHQNARH